MEDINRESINHSFKLQREKLIIIIIIIIKKKKKKNREKNFEVLLIWRGRSKRTIPEIRRAMEGKNRDSERGKRVASLWRLNQRRPLGRAMISQI